MTRSGQAGGTGDGGPRVQFAPLDAIVSEPLPFGTAWQVQGDSGIGKTILAAQFAMQGLRRGESVVFVACDDAPRRVCASLQRFGFAIGSYENQGRLLLVDAFSGGDSEPYALADKTDPEEFVYLLAEALAEVARPVRVITDSMTSVAAYLRPGELLRLVYEKNRILKGPEVVLLDLYLSDALDPREMTSLSNAYDLMVRLFYAEDRGGIGRRNLRVQKARGSSFDPRPFPYAIRQEHGLLVEADCYHH